jgi:protein-tyrosine phosphatase
VNVRFPDGTRINALSIYERKEHDDQRDFGLYMYEKWQPTWPAEVIPWPNFSVPADWESAAVQIEAAFARAKAGQNVEIGCRVGLGRTGTVLACMAVLSGVPAAEAVTWVRKNYNSGAVETPEQESWVRWFAGRFANRFAKPS